MRSLTRVAGLAASLALTLGSIPAAAQVYPPPITTPPPGYAPQSAAPPPAPAPRYHGDEGYYGGRDYRRYRAHYYRRHYRRYHRHYYYHRRYAYGCHRRNGAIGAVAGAVGGGIIGSAITHGNPAFTMIGAGAGALTGHALGRSSGC